MNSILGREEATPERKSSVKRWVWTLVIVAAVIILAVLSTGCASTGKTLAKGARPNDLLVKSAMECANLDDESKRDTCIVGVKSEENRSIKTAEAAASTVHHHGGLLGGGYVMGPVYGGGVTISGGGYGGSGGYNVSYGPTSCPGGGCGPQYPIGSRGGTNVISGMTTTITTGPGGTNTGFGTGGSAPTITSPGGANTSCPGCGNAPVINTPGGTNRPGGN
ncbi:hypothetical protein K8Q98_01165 [Candidatus Nomurabacteria bacterium]|nr:hypothetical protein [Candidatus Nomurabacteria bacterium]